MQNDPSFAVLGFRPHTYWTSAVALGGDVEAPQVIHRRRIVFATGEERFAYHHAAEIDPSQAAPWIETVRGLTVANAAREVGALVADLARSGIAVSTAVVSAATAKLPAQLEDILRVHARMHSAEGNFYRDVVASGCEATGLVVHREVEREFAPLVADLLGLSQPQLQSRLKAMGATLGPPWSEDYRLATLAAWMHLADAQTR